MIRKPAGVTARARRARRAKRQREAKSVYDLVDERDGYVCRSCGRNKWFSIFGPEHHHMTYRSQGGAETTSNLLTLCGQCHADVHAHRLQIHGDDANGPLTFERR